MREGADRKPRGRACGLLKATVRKTKLGSRLVHCGGEESVRCAGEAISPSPEPGAREAAPRAVLTAEGQQVALCEEGRPLFPPPPLTPFLF